VVPPAFPSYANQRADLSAVDFYLDSFRINGGSKRDTPATVALVRGSFLAYVERFATFRSVNDATGKRGEVAGHALRADLVIDVAHTSERNMFLHFLAAWPFTLYWPFTPQKGDAHVDVKMTLFDHQGTQVLRSRHGSAAHYDMLTYSWFRTEPVERAYAIAYGDAFTATVEELADQQSTILAALGLRAGEPTLATLSLPESMKGLRIAVMPTQFDASASNVPDLFDDYLLTAVQNTASFEVIGQSDIQSLLGFEAQRDLLGCDDATCIAEIGGALGVDLVLGVRVAKLENDWVLTAKLINMRHTRVDARNNQIVQGEVSDLLRAVPHLVVGLFANLAG